MTRRTRLARIVAVALLVAVLSPVAHGAGANEVSELRDARVVFGAPRPSAPDAGRPQALPHTWWTTDETLKGDAWYLLRHRLPAVPAGPQALYLTGITIPAEVWVNGRMIGATGPLDGRRPRSYEQSHLFTIGGDVLREGDNEILVHVRAPNADVAALAPVRIGSAASLRREAVGDLVAHTLGPAAVSIAILTVGLFLLALWLRRREPSHVALFGAAAILWGLHTGVSLLPDPPIPSPHYGIWWHGVYMLFVVLLCLFCIRFANFRWPRYERLAIGFALLVVPALYIARFFGIAGPVSDAIRLFGIVMVVWALAGMAYYVFRNPGTDSRLLLATGVVSVAFAIHDWLAAVNPTSVRPVWLVPYAALAFLVLVGWILVDRFVRALNEAERINVDLEGRVAEKSAELSAQLAQTRAAKEIAETANAARSRFFAAASHDLRQPLHAIGLFASTLSEHASGAEERALAQRISVSVESLEAHFSSLLDVSRLDAGAVPVRVVHVPANVLLDRIANDFGPEALERGLSLAVVPSGGIVRTDVMLIERILRNLVANALRYTRRGGVVVGCRRRGPDLAFEVWDTGPGIPSGECDRIFEEFHRATPGGDDAQPGLGLGLSIVRRLCELLGHRIELESRPGRGSVFRVIVPRGDAADVAAPVSESIPPVDFTGRRIVVVDDDAPVREGMHKLLAAWGCTPIVVADADGAVAALAGGPVPDALVVDYRLAAGRDGLEAIATIRAAVRGHVPALLVSGESHAAELAKIKASGIRIVHKPVPPARLRSVLAWIMSTREGSGG